MEWGSGVLDHHRDKLESSAICAEVAYERGYVSVFLGGFDGPLLGNKVHGHCKI